MHGSTIPDKSDRTLLTRCAHGDPEAVDLLVERYVTAGLPIASRLAGAGAPSDQVIDVVHDAFIKAFDDAMDDDADSPAPLFTRLLGVSAAALRDTPTGHCDAPQAITPADVRQLRRDVVNEVRLTVALRMESPQSWRSARRIVQQLRAMRRRLKNNLKLGPLDD